MSIPLLPPGEALTGVGMSFPLPVGEGVRVLTAVGWSHYSYPCKGRGPG
jgi:hypothetical protein